MTKTWLFFPLILVLTHLVTAQQQAQRYPLIPYPASLIPGDGQFSITAKTALVVADSRFQNEASQFQQLVSRGLGKQLPGNVLTTKVVLQYDPTITAPEGYELVITPRQMTLKAAAPAGMFRAVQTIRQLLPDDIDQKKGQPLKTLTLPAVQIRDQPAHPWRGMHLDVARHFFSIDYLHTFIDWLALYKFNKFHLHLTDDQGWRMEINAFPKLTTVGAWRTFNNQDSVVLKRAQTEPDFDLPKAFIRQQNGQTQYGGFYTQAQLRELIAYAAARHIEIIPEIDMPGHLDAAIRAYPFLSCTGQSGWGETFSVPICPCNEPTYAFTEAVLSEVAALFPSPYIHIGADEVEKTTWTQTPACQELMKREGLKTVNALQSYFVHRMETFIASKGKKMLVWDDALDGGLSPSATVMYWRSWVKDAPLKAAQNGNAVVMTPVSTLYFDYAPTNQSLSNIYAMNVVPNDIPSQQATQFMGVQANTWTEYISTTNRLEYMIMPRLTALAELAWTAKKDEAAYQQRLLTHYARMEKMGIHYRLPDLTGFVQENVFADATTLHIDKPIDSYSLHYTINGSVPKETSPVLGNRLVINKPQTIKVAAFTPLGLRGDVYTLNYRQQAYAQPLTLTGRQPGLSVAFFRKFFKETKLMQQQISDTSFTTTNVAVPALGNIPSFGMQFRGYVRVPETGIYSFFFTCDDGGSLRIADRMVVDNDGNHGPVEKSGQVALQQGAHPLAIDFIEGGGGFTLKLAYSLNGSKPQPIPDSWLTQ